MRSPGDPGGPAPEPRPAGAGRIILLIEDHDDTREMLALLLGKLGHAVHAAADGPSGLDAVRALEPDAVIVDIGLPGLDGHEVARRIRDAGGRQPFLIALTGRAAPEDESSARAAGFDAHLPKPLEIERLVGLLDGAPARSVP